MNEDLSKLDQWALLNRLRVGFGVPDELVKEIGYRLNDGKHQRAHREQAERRIEELSRHLPPEVLNPPTAFEIRRGPRWAGD